MKIKTENGEMNVTSQGQGSLNTVLGAVGTASALGLMGGLFGQRRGQQQPDGEDRPVTRYEMGLIKESLAKDTEIAQLKANIYTDNKVGVVNQRLNDFEKSQMLYNGANNATIACIQRQVNELYGLTKIVVPNGNIAPGWGPFPVITPEVQQSASSSTPASGN